MRISRLYIDALLEIDTDISLTKEQAHYLATVLRMRKNDKVYLFNNEDAEYLAIINELDKKSANLSVISKQICERESTLNTTLGIGMARGQHMDFAIQKSVELGVNRIVPLITEFSNVKVSEDRVENKLQHWQQIIIHAAEQCGRTHIPQLFKPQKVNEFIISDKDALKIIFHPETDVTITQIKENPQSVSILIGPEGGFSESEIELATQNNFKLLTLGPRVLRAETAVVSALTACQFAWGDLA